MRYLARFLNAADPTASLRHAAYAVVIGCSCGWLTYGLLKPGLDGNWVAAFGLLLTAVTAGKVLGKSVGVAAPSASGAPGSDGGNQ